MRVPLLLLAFMFLILATPALPGQAFAPAPDGIRDRRSAVPNDGSSVARWANAAAVAMQDTARRRSIAPYLLVGALAGALIGAAVEADFHDDFCTPGPGVSCSSDYDGIGIVIGAGLGALAGWVIYALTSPPAAPAPSSP